MFRLKLTMAVTVLLLVAGSGVAFAASGNLPEPVQSLIGNSAALSVYGDQDTDSPHQDDQDVDDADDQGSGGGVSSIARDKNAMGIKMLPNGKMIENHGQAVSQAAKAQHDDEGNGNQPQTESEQDEDEGGNQNQNHQNKDNEKENKNL